MFKGLFIHICGFIKDTPMGMILIGNVYVKRAIAPYGLNMLWMGEGGVINPKVAPVIKEN